MAEKELQLDFIWWEKAATRVPEGLWLGMNPLASGARIQKLGQPVDPLDVVRFGGRAPVSYTHLLQCKWTKSNFTIRFSIYSSISPFCVSKIRVLSNANQPISKLTKGL